MTGETHATSDDRLFVLAFYIVVDVSASMGQNGGLGEVNEILPKIIDAIDASPTLGDVVRIGALDFADDATVVLRLGDVRDVTAIPKFAIRGATSYAAAFRLLRHEIERDQAQLRSDNFRMYRPVAFFITDGEPTDDEHTLKTSFAELTDPAFKPRPNIIPFGVGKATKASLEPWVFPKPGESKKPMRSYVAREGVDPAAALSQVAEVLVSSILASAN